MTTTASPLAAACGPVSRRLLRAFPDLDLVPAPDGRGGWCVRDRELGGAFGMPPEEAALVYRLARAARPVRALEIGASVGWSTAHLAAALPPGAVLDVVDPFTEQGRAEACTALGAHHAPTAERWAANLIRSGLIDRCRLHVAPSPDVLPSVAPAAGWDFALVDGWHNDGQPQRDVAGLLPHLAPGATVLVHDAHLSDVAAACGLLRAAGYALVDLGTPHSLTLARGPR